VINLLDILSIESSHILGHSMGGKVAMQIALSHSQRVNKLIVADIAPVEYPAHHITIIEGLQAIDLTKVQKRTDADTQLAKYVEDVGVRQFLLRNIIINKQGEFNFKCNLNNIEQGYQQIMQSNENQDNQIFSGDTLFIKGGDSDYILPEHQNIIIEMFPRGKAKIIQGAGHWLHAEKPSEFYEKASEFLS
jgi:esterase